MVSFVAGQMPLMHRFARSSLLIQPLRGDVPGLPDGFDAVEIKPSAPDPAVMAFDANVLQRPTFGQGLCGLNTTRAGRGAVRC
ncbi:MAG: hypothetical protein ACK5MY_10470 [Jhaorihella sp.]